MNCEIEIGGDGEPFDGEVYLSRSTEAATCCECQRPNRFRSGTRGLCCES